ncbi:TPA: hypothetical protein ACGVA4_004249 [Vibrio vulnificus]
MKKYHLYKVDLGYSSTAFVKIKSILDVVFIFQYAPSGSLAGKTIFLYKLLLSIIQNKKSHYEMPSFYFDSNRCFILIPWSQSKDEKFCLITKNSFSKHSKSVRADLLLKNEYDGAIAFHELLNTNGVLVQIPNYINKHEGSILEYPLLKGKRNKGIIDLDFNHFSNVCDFYQTLYFKKSKVVLDSFLKPNYPHIYKELFEMLYQRKIIEVNVSPMHGDFSNSNVMKVNDDIVIIDFEEYIKEGVDIENEYYKFRYRFDRYKSFSIRSDVDLLCVYHYLFFQSKNESKFTFDNITLDNNELRLLL